MFPDPNSANRRLPRAVMALSAAALLSVSSAVGASAEGLRPTIAPARSATLESSAFPTSTNAPHVIADNSIGTDRLSKPATGLPKAPVPIDNVTHLPPGPSVLLDATVLNPTHTRTIGPNQWHRSNDSWCVASLQSVGLGPDLDVNAINATPGEIAVGFDHYYDPGTDPLPCDAQSATYYRGAVEFDWNRVNSFISADGGHFGSAVLQFQQDTGTQLCIDHISVRSDPWENPGDLPDDGLALYPTTTQLPGGGFTDEVDVTAAIALSAGLGGGVAPHLHFVYAGSNEDLNAQDNNRCDSTLSGFRLLMNP